MQTETVLLIILAALVAISVALFQYFFRSKHRGNLYILLAFLRFLGVFGILLLLINPQFAKTSYQIENPVLAVLVDNSTSVKDSGKDVESILADLKNSRELNERFTINSYIFGEGLKTLDSLTYLDDLTNIAEPLTSINEAYRRKQSAILLISDGNQTVGRDYAYNLDTKQPVYTITLGDTTAYEDLSIGPINVNRYAFLNNKFPVESYVAYQGDGVVNARVNISVDGKSIFSENLRLSESDNLKNINTLLEANNVGTKKIRVYVSALPSEKNMSNNSRETSVEVIDEKTNIGLVSQILHPDLGTFKKSIESNEQRKVHFLKPNTPTRDLDEMDMFILYEPNGSFNSVFEHIKNKKANYLIISGVNTDFNFLNQVQGDFTVELGYPVQEVFGSLNPGFSSFDISDFDMDSFPPLSSDAGPVVVNVPNGVLLNSEVKGININSPMLSIMEDAAWKRGVWLGTDIWRWRAQVYRNSGDFSNFDIFMGKLIRYLTGNTKRDRLNLEYNTLFEGNSSAIITATYFDETYVFDPNATLNLSIVNSNDNVTSTRPMVLKNGYYESDLSDLAPGSYNFTVHVDGEGLSKKGSFTISDFNLEKQFVSSNYKKMGGLAENTGGKSFFPDQKGELINALLANSTFLPTQKSIENIVSLVDYRILLAIIVLAFATEWFLRKYNGLI